MRIFKEMGDWASGRVGGESKGRVASAPPASTSPYLHTRRYGRRTPTLLAMTLLLILSTSGCSYYSFTGATIPENLNTVAIPLTQDNSTSPFPELSSTLTDLLIDRFVGRTRLRLESNASSADAVLDSRLVGYQNEPTAVSGDERAALNRVTVRVRVTYTDQTEQGPEEPLIARTFSGAAEYDPVADGQQGELAAANAALENVADDIFSEATSDF